MTKFGTELLQSVEEALAIARGEMLPARVFAPEKLDVAAIRKGLKLSQDKFAQRFHLSPATLRDWEQGRRQPDLPARNFLKLIAYAPETVQRALQTEDAA